MVEQQTRLQLSPDTETRFSLRKLIPIVEASHQGMGPRTSEKIYWLSDAMETPGFWSNLHQHLLDDPDPRHGAGSIFSKEQGEVSEGPYDWYHLYSSLDRFLQKFGARATEFIFRDFRPETRNPELFNRIRAARLVALDRFPRLRRIYWDDYQEILGTPIFWQGMINDLDQIQSPISSAQFFDKEVTSSDRTELQHLGTDLERKMLRRFIAQAGDFSQRAQMPDYRSMSQMIREFMKQNPRTFFLQFNSSKSDEILKGLIAQAKVLIGEKILPIRENTERILHISRAELNELTATPQFWDVMASDFERYTVSDTLTYNLDTFLRFYDRDDNAIVSGRLGAHAYTTTAFAEKIKGQTYAAIKDPSKKASFYLMWQVPVNDENKEPMQQAKRLATELFRNDCLYVNLQLPEFWEKFQQDLNMFSGSNSFSSFIRNFSRRNPTARSRAFKASEGYYFRYHNRADYNPEELSTILQQLELPVSDNFKQNLKNLLFNLAPDDVKKLITEKFPGDYKPSLKKAKAKDRKLLEEAKAFLGNFVMGDPSSPSAMIFENAGDNDRFREKLASASRSLRIPILTETVSETSFMVYVSAAKRWNKDEVILRDARVKILRIGGLSNDEIAAKLQIPDHLVESSVTRLVRKREIEPKKPFGR